MVSFQFLIGFWVGVLTLINRSKIDIHVHVGKTSRARFKGDIYI